MPFASVSRRIFSVAGLEGSAVNENPPSPLEEGFGLVTYRPRSEPCRHKSALTIPLLES